jgi:hypothetical protein
LPAPGPPNNMSRIVLIVINDVGNRSNANPESG